MTLDEAFARFPRLVTPRLVLRAIQAADAEALFATFSDEQVMAFYGHLPHRTVDDSRALIRQLHDWYARREGIRWGIMRRDDDTAEVIGSCGFYGFDDGCHRAEAGYELRRAFWRQGIMREALSAVLSFAFESLGLHRIEAVVDDVNEPSKALLRSLGFTHEGTLRQRFHFRERYWDEHYFGLLRGEWQAGAVTPPVAIQ
jgi:[ribosomal protein S5]-alanine N-acetyltransferase